MVCCNIQPYSLWYIVSHYCFHASPIDRWIALLLVPVWLDADWYRHLVMPANGQLSVAATFSRSCSCKPCTDTIWLLPLSCWQRHCILPADLASTILLASGQGVWLYIALVYLRPLHRLQCSLNIWKHQQRSSYKMQSTFHMLQHWFLP